MATSETFTTVESNWVMNGPRETTAAIFQIRESSVAGGKDYLCANSSAVMTDAWRGKIFSVKTR